MKKLFVTLLCSVLFIGVRPINSFAETKEEQREPSIYVNDVLFKFENLKPIVRNDRVLIPLKSGFFQTIGLEATYDIIIQIIRTYIVNVASDSKIIPIRAITESVGLDMNYNDENYSISIKC